MDSLPSQTELFNNVAPFIELGKHCLPNSETESGEKATQCVANSENTSDEKARQCLANSENAPDEKATQCVANSKIAPDEKAKQCLANSKIAPGEKSTQCMANLQLPNSKPFTLPWLYYFVRDAAACILAFREDSTASPNNHFLQIIP